MGCKNLSEKLIQPHAPSYVKPSNLEKADISARGHEVFAQELEILLFESSNPQSDLTSSE